MDMRGGRFRPGSFSSGTITPGFTPGPGGGIFHSSRSIDLARATTTKYFPGCPLTGAEWTTSGYSFHVVTEVVNCNSVKPFRGFPAGMRRFQAILRSTVFQSPPTTGSKSSLEPDSPAWITDVFHLLSSSASGPGRGLTTWLATQR